MNVNAIKTRDYKNETLSGYGKNKPNSNPIQTQSNPISTQNKPNQSQSNPISEKPKWIWGIVNRGKKKVQRQKGGKFMN